MQNTKRVFCHILLDCAVPRFISKQPVMREKLIEMVLHTHYLHEFDFQYTVMIKFERWLNENE